MFAGRTDAARPAAGDTLEYVTDSAAPAAPAPRRRRRWLRWTLGGLGALVVVLVGGILIYSQVGVMGAEPGPLA